MPLVKAQCTNCGGTLEVDNSKEAAVCPFCNTPYIVEKAINNYTTNVTNNIQAQNVTIIGGKDFNQLFNSAKALFGVSQAQGSKYCDEALSLQPDNYEVWALRAKYFFLGLECIDEKSIKKVNELTPNDKISHVSKDLFDFFISYCKEHRTTITSITYQNIIIKAYFCLEKLSPEDSVTCAMEIMDLAYAYPNLMPLTDEVKKRMVEDFEKCSADFKRSFDSRDLIISAAKEVDREYIMDKNNPAKSPIFTISSKGELKKVRIQDENAYTTITIPKDVVSVDQVAFMDISCGCIKKIIFENTNEIKIEENTFVLCSSLTEIVGNVKPVTWNSQPAKGFLSSSEEFYDKNPQYNPELNSGKKGCYVATCVYGSYDCPQVWTLRRYRDYTLAETWYGRAFIRTYYAISPTLVKWFGKTKWFKNMWQGKLDRMVKRLNNEGVEDTPYQDRNW